MIARPFLKLVPIMAALTAVSLTNNPLSAQNQGESPTAHHSMSERHTATGSFEIETVPQQDEAFPAGRLTIDKQYSGLLEATGLGQMLSHRSSVKGSAGYVAIEVVTGTLDGRSGSFALQHVGLMNRGAPSLSVSIIPDSGTDQLAGIAGEMTIVQSGGAHSYTLTYSIVSESD